MIVSVTSAISCSRHSHSLQNNEIGDAGARQLLGALARKTALKEIESVVVY